MSEPIQRLKWIHQGGAIFLVNKKWYVTQYELSRCCAHFTFL